MFAGCSSQRDQLGYAFGMQVHVLYFGILKDIFGCDGQTQELAEGATVADLVTGYRLSEGYAKGSPELWNSLAVAVNQVYARPGDVLSDGDEVALLPPVSGGGGGGA
jgi:molybdopterin converting factor small subunit